MLDFVHLMSEASTNYMHSVKELLIGITVQVRTTKIINPAMYVCSEI